MKLERLSDNQIKITLAPYDFNEFDVTVVDLLTDRNGKAKSFFETLMSMAKDDLDFEVDGAPLVVEAMQTGKDSLVLMVTKVDEDSDTDPKLEHIRKMRGSFSGSDGASDDDGFEDVSSTVEPLPNIPLKSDENIRPVVPSFGVCSFERLEPLIQVAEMAVNYYESDNSLYKNPIDNRYYLVYTRNWNSEDEFKILTNQLREFGDPGSLNYASRYYIEEHCKILIEGDALQKLSEL